MDRSPLLTPDNNPDFNRLMKDFLDLHKKAASGKRHTMNNMVFENNAMYNLTSLATSIHNRTYQPSHSIAFIIRQPVIREIFAASFRDRTVHHYIYEKTMPWWLDQLIPNTYSCIKGRGTLKAILDTYEMMREISNNFTEPTYYLKMDLQGFFMSLNRQKLLHRALQGLNEQYKGNRGYEFYTLDFLWKQTILDDPVKTCTTRHYPRDWKDLPPSKSLFNQPPGVGIVIGNLTSQELSNVYLDNFDHYVSERLGWPYYARYVDDFLFFAREQDMDKALADIKRIEVYLKGMGLTLHPRKRQIQPIQRGLPFLGTVIYPNHIAPGRRIKKNALHAAEQYHLGLCGGESIISYLGLMQHYDSSRISDQILDIIFPEDDRFIEHYY